MKEMTPRERCLAVLAHQQPDCVPVVPQAFLVACETAGFKIGKINSDGRKLAQSHILCQEKFGYDGCVIDVDDATLAEACGARVHFREDEVATVDEHHPCVSDIREVQDLKLPDPYSSARLPVWLEATQTLVDAIGDDVFIMGRADQGPFDLLCMLRGTENFMVDLLTEDEDAIHTALQWCKEAVLRFTIAQKAAGAHATSIGDSYAGPNLVSPEIYRKFALEPERQMVVTLKKVGIPFAVHICGDTTSILNDMLSTGAEILEVDWKVDMGAASRLVGDRSVLMGNIDPSAVMVSGSPAQVEAGVRQIIEQTGGRNLFMSSGCALGRNTPAENLRAMVDATRKYGQFVR